MKFGEIVPWLLLAGVGYVGLKEWNSIHSTITNPLNALPPVTVAPASGLSLPLPAGWVMPGEGSGVNTTLLSSCPSGSYLSSGYGILTQSQMQSLLVGANYPSASTLTGSQLQAAFQAYFGGSVISCGIS